MPKPTLPLLISICSNRSLLLSTLFSWTISFIWHVLKTISKGSCSLFKFQLELFSALSNIPGFANLIVDRQQVYTVQQTSLLCDLSFDPRPKIMFKFSPVTSYGLMSGLDPLTFYE